MKPPGKKRGTAMLYPDDYELIKVILQKSVEKYGKILVPQYAVPFTASREEIFMTFSPSPNSPHPIVRFWTVTESGFVVDVVPEVVFEERAYHEGYPWFEEGWSLEDLEI